MIRYFYSEAILCSLFFVFFSVFECSILNKKQGGASTASIRGMEGAMLLSSEQQYGCRGAQDKQREVRAQKYRWHHTRTHTAPGAGGAVRYMQGEHANKKPERSQYIAERAKLAHNLTKREILQLQYQNREGAAVLYQKSDLQYDTQQGYLQITSGSQAEGGTAPPEQHPPSKAKS